MNHDKNDDADLSRGHLTIAASKTRFFGSQQQNRTAAGWKGASVPAEPIRVIVVIVVIRVRSWPFAVGQDFVHLLSRVFVPYKEARSDATEEADDSDSAPSTGRSSQAHSNSGQFRRWISTNAVAMSIASDLDRALIIA